ncbi:hypothetical protein DL93DRAFT_2169624 [Clavulina sp. PMI_390]|nr:hypothetical protein DL93DRAFT_2169624 [Clavulina sp. PMI_390]
MINTIPPELLSQIFIHGVPRIEAEPVVPTRPVDEMAAWTGTTSMYQWTFYRQTLMLTCRAWHNVCIQTPQLWTYIAWPPTVRADQISAALGLYAKRSGVLPLIVYVDLRLIQSRPLHGASTCTALQLFNLSVLPRIGQLRFFSANTDSSNSVWEKIIQMFTDPCCVEPRVQSLHGHGFPLLVPQRFVSMLEMRTQQLSVRLKSALDLLSFGEPFPLLTSLDLRNTSVNPPQLTQLLERCPSLKSLRVMLAQRGDYSCASLGRALSQLRFLALYPFPFHGSTNGPFGQFPTLTPSPIPGKGCQHIEVSVRALEEGCFPNVPGATVLTIVCNPFPPTSLRRGLVAAPAASFGCIKELRLHGFRPTAHARYSFSETMMVLASPDLVRMAFPGLSYLTIQYPPCPDEVCRIGDDSRFLADLAHKEVLSALSKVLEVLPDITLRVWLPYTFKLGFRGYESWLDSQMMIRRWRESLVKDFGPRVVVLDQWPPEY